MNFLVEIFFFVFLEYDDSIAGYGNVADFEGGYDLDVGQPEFGMVRVMDLDPGLIGMLRLDPTYKSRGKSGLLRIL